MYFKFRKVTSVKSFNIQLPVLLFSFLHQISFMSTDIIFYNFFELHSTLSEKDFHHKFCFLTDSLNPQHTRPNTHTHSLMVKSAKWDKLFLSILKCLLKYFFSNICSRNPAKASCLYQQWTATVHIFLKFPIIDSLVFFLTQASVVTSE